MKYSLGIDIGGTNIAAGIVDENYNIVCQSKVKTQSDREYTAVLEDIAAVGKSAVEKAGMTIKDIQWVGLGCPGTCNLDTGVVEYANNLRWTNVPLKSYVEQALGIPAYIENDANAAALGEFLAGAAKGADSAIIITIGTGLGAGIIIDGKLFSGSNYAGAEIGHTVINVDGEQCTCGRKGCFEAYSSVTALVKFTKRFMEQYPDTLMKEIAEKEGKVSGRTAFVAAKQGDEAGTKVVELFIKNLACGIINTINVFQPDILCIGGGVSNEGDNLLIPLKEHINSEIYSKNSKKNTEIVTCQLGNGAGLIGAALLGYQYQNA